MISLLHTHHLLVEIFQPDLSTTPPALRAHFEGDHTHADA
jgi:hypothetical protein